MPIRKIDPEKCIGCEACIPYCTVGAIHLENEKKISVIDQDEFVECGVCHRANVCPTDAIYRVELRFPRSLRGPSATP